MSRDIPIIFSAPMMQTLLAGRKTMTRRLANIPCKLCQTGKHRCQYWQRGGPRTWFRELWDALHGTGSWDSNPEVVALTFSTHQGNIDSLPKVEAA